MSDSTPRLQLPFIIPGQAQKELFWNEALIRIDAALHAAVEGVSNVPPVNVPEGQAWLVGLAPTGEWAGKENMLAVWTDGGWRFVVPVVGMTVWNKSSGYSIHWLGSGWSAGEQAVESLRIGGKKVVGERQPAVPSPSGGTIIDEEARGAIAAITAALKSHGLTE